MNHKQYKDTYLGFFKKEPGIATSECVWNSKLYSKEVFGFTLGSFGGSALSGWENKNNTFDPKFWDRILNTPDAIPQEGDFICWGTALGKFGHIAVYDSGNVRTMGVVSQNSTGANGDVPGDEIILKTYSYKGCLGWYRFKRPAVAVSINGALEEPMSVKIEAKIPKKSGIKKENTSKIVIPYNQKTDPYCTAFSSAGAWTYNHGKKFTDKEIYTWADPILKGNGGMTSRIADKFAKWQGGKCLITTIFSSLSEKLLDYGYALIIRTRCPAEFWTDGINDGVVDGKDYKPKDDSGHAIVLIKEGEKYKLVNSWGDYEKKGKFNTYEIDAKTLFKSGLILSECFFIY